MVFLMTESQVGYYIAQGTRLDNMAALSLHNFRSVEQSGWSVVKKWIGNYISIPIMMIWE